MSGEGKPPVTDDDFGMGDRCSQVKTKAIPEFYRYSFGREEGLRISVFLMLI